MSSVLPKAPSKKDAGLIALVDDYIAWLSRNRPEVREITISSAQHKAISKQVSTFDGDNMTYKGYDVTVR